MQTRQLYALVSATSSGVTYVELPFNARLKCIVWSIAPTTTPANGDLCLCEVSSSPTGQTNVLDATGILAVFGLAFSVLTSGSLTAVNGWIPCDYTVKAGERLYLNTAESGGNTYQVRARLVFQ
jgi:hypothetical protein